jgi:hypothetical protein
VKLDEEDKDCGKFEKIAFAPESLINPICRSADAGNSNFSALTGSKLKCRPGSSQDIKGKCREKIKFNFNG